MGYRSQVEFKTTTEGYLTLKRFNDKIPHKVERPLYNAEIKKTESGFYKISFDNVKWYDSYIDVQNFIKVMDILDEQDIPYKFIRLGEDIDDIEVRENYTEDMPEQLSEFNPSVEIYDTNECDYDWVPNPDEGGCL